MIRTLHLRDFKNFADATVAFGPFTVLIGANASGKSNVRDALRFLQGVGLGYTLAEIMGGKYGPGGLPLWAGIRGGLAETARHGSDGFSIGIQFDVPGRREPVQYQLEVETTGTPSVLRESLVMPGFKRPLFSTHPDGEALGGETGRILARVYQPARGRDPVLDFVDDRPVLMQIPNNSRVRIDVRERVGEAVAALTAMRFLDLSPERMREPSPQGQEATGRPRRQPLVRPRSPQHRRTAQGSAARVGPGAYTDGHRGLRVPARPAEPDSRVPQRGEPA